VEATGIGGEEEEDDVIRVINSKSEEGEGHG
jgi:hypothetical protein